jgi:hypothetical protein
MFEGLSYPRQLSVIEQQPMRGRGLIMRQHGLQATKAGTE